MTQKSLVVLYKDIPILGLGKEHPNKNRCCTLEEDSTMIVKSLVNMRKDFVYLTQRKIKKKGLQV